MDLLFRDTIGVFPNAFSNELCDKILSMYYDSMEKNQIYEGISGAGVNYDIKRSKDWQLIGSGHRDEYEITEKIRQNFIEHVGVKYCGGFPHQDKSLTKSNVICLLVRMVWMKRLKLNYTNWVRM